MREKMIYEKYSDDNQYKYEVYQNEIGIFEIWVQRRITDEYMGNDWFDYSDISDMRHFTETLERAIEVGDELLRNFK